MRTPIADFVQWIDDFTFLNDRPPTLDEVSKQSFLAMEEEREIIKEAFTTGYMAHMLGWPDADRQADEYYHLMFKRFEDEQI